jgi:iron complex outermembrane receptor protein
MSAQRQRYVSSKACGKDLPLGARAVTRLLILILGVGVLTGGAYAEAGGDPPAEYFDDLPVVLSASRLVQPVADAPVAVTVIDRETIRASGARQIEELFRLVPGFVVGHRSGHEATVTYHGLADGYARRLQVMIDGISIYSPIYGGVEWRELPIAIEDIERIEVVRGPNGASFGANAFVGMVNIITREPAGKGTNASVNSGSNGIADWNLQHSDSDERWRYRVSVGQRSDHGFAALGDDSRVNYLNLRSYLRIDGANEVSGTFAHSDGVGQIDLGFVRPQRFEDNDVHLRWTRATDAGSEFWLQFHHGQRHLTEDQNYQVQTPALAGILPAMTVPVNIAFKAESHRDELEFQRTDSAGTNWRWLWGGQWRQDGVKSQQLFSRSDWLTNSLVRLFVSGEWRPQDSLLLHAGATYEHPSLGSSGISPRLSATAFVADGHTLRASISQAQRNPTPYEEATDQGYAVPEQLRAAVLAIPRDTVARIPEPYRTMLFLPIYKQPFLASGGLVSERILSREIAYLGRFPSLRLDAELRWFSDHVRDLIYVYRISVPTFSSIGGNTGDFRNADTARVTGVEGSLQWTAWHGAHLLVAAARTRIASSNIDANYSLTAPTQTVSALLRQQLPWNLSASLGYYRVGAMQWLSDGNLLPTTERCDLRLSRSFNWEAHRAEVSWVTQNLTGNAYPDFFSKLTARRVSWLQLRYDY